jgi:hypothetical protein
MSMSHDAIGFNAYLRPLGSQPATYAASQFGA